MKWMSNQSTIIILLRHANGVFSIDDDRLFRQPSVWMMSESSTYKLQDY